jgi:HK97 family phage portal protein
VSRLRRAFGLEERSLADDLANGFPGNVTGTVGWQQGMVWNGYPNGSTVTVDSAMRLSAVFACLRLLSDAISTLPVDTFRREGGTRRPYRPRPDYLSFAPPQGSKIDYLSQVVLSLLTDGNAYVLTPRDRFGVPVDLIVLDPSTMTVSRVAGKVEYRCMGIELDRYDLMHIKGMTLPGALVGLSPIACAREGIGLGLAAQEYGRQFLNNGATPGGVIELPGNGGPEDKVKARRVAAAWNETHQGPSAAGKTAVLIGNATYKGVSISHRDAQYLETRQFQVPDIARIFGVPPHLIADASNSTSWGSGLAEQNLAFGQFALRPWIERIEDAHGRLLTSHGLPDVFLRLNLDALLRASLSDRYTSYATGINAGFLTVNEARALEDLPPVPGGDQPTPNLAMAPPGGGE